MFIPVNVLVYQQLLLSSPNSWNRLCSAVSASPSISPLHFSHYLQTNWYGGKVGQTTTVNTSTRLRTAQMLSEMFVHQLTATQCLSPEFAQSAGSKQCCSSTDLTALSWGKQVGKNKSRVISILRKLKCRAALRFQSMWALLVGTGACSPASNYPSFLGPNLHRHSRALQTRTVPRRARNSSSSISFLYSKYAHCGWRTGCSRTPLAGILTAPLKFNLGDFTWPVSLSGRSLPALALLTDVFNKRFGLCNSGEGLSVCPPLKAGLEQPNPFHSGNSVWAHRHTEVNTQAEAQRAPVNTTFPSSHIHVKKWDGLWTLCVQRDLSF